MTSHDDDDAPRPVGYGHPPPEHRFKPGQSGNPKGRKRGERNFKTEVEEILKTPVPVTQNGKRRTVTARKAVLLKELERALKGDARAADRLLSRAERMSTIEPTGDSGALADDDKTILESYLAELRARKPR